jgi:hypothetical protein
VGEAMTTKRYGDSELVCATDIVPRAMTLNPLEDVVLRAFDGNQPAYSTASLIVRLMGDRHHTVKQYKAYVTVYQSRARQPAEARTTDRADVRRALFEWPRQTVCKRRPRREAGAKSSRR